MILRRWLLALPLVLGLAGAAYAQGAVQQLGQVTAGHGAKWVGPGMIMDSGLPSTQGAPPYLDATNYGVVADGATPNDAALAAAVTACSAIGGSLYLPAGGILLTGTQSIQLKNCRLVGQGTFNGGGQNLGTTILLTSQATTSFVCGSDWRIEGVNFYWPTQVSGTTVYPPLFADNGSVGCNRFSLENVAIVNAYDVFTATGSLSWGAVRISNSQIYALDHFWKIGNTGDFVLIENTILDPGVWLALAPGTPTNNAINAADQVNIIFDVSSGPGVGFLLNNVGAFAWRYGYLVRSGGALNAGTPVQWDGVATFLDTSSGGALGGAGSVVISCPNGGCVAGIASYPGGAATTGNFPVFNLGAGAGTLTVNDFHLSQAQGSVVVSAGQAVEIKNSDFAAWGNAADGNEYYTVRVTANLGGTSIRYENNLSAPAASTHVHGIKNDVALAGIEVQNSRFQNLNDALNLVAASLLTTITENTSTSTQGTVSAAISGTNATVNYHDNQWDKPPKAAVTSCGTGATVTGALAGFISVGSTNPTTTCTLTLPWVPYGTSCNFTPSGGGALTATVGGTPPTYSIVTAADIHGGQIFYNCAGYQ